MKRVRRQSEMPTRPWLADLKDNLPWEFIGLVLFLIGGGVLLTLLRGGVNSTLGVPYAVIALGWVTPWFALVLLIIGAVFMLGERAGYWGIEAIVGVELLFLSGMMTAFLWHNETVTWEARHDGLNGGLVGWALGSLLMAGLGRWPALAVVWLLAVIGAYLILRYTPLIYLAPFAKQVVAIDRNPRALNFGRFGAAMNGCGNILLQWVNQLYNIPLPKVSKPSPSQPKTQA